jgi:hypothetical protein
MPQNTKSVQEAFDAFDAEVAKEVQWVAERNAPERAAAQNDWQNFRTQLFPTMRQEFFNLVAARNGRVVDMESSDNVIGLTLYSLSGRVAPTGVTLAFRFHPKYLTISPYIYYKGDQQQGTPIGTNENTKGMATQWFGHFLAEFFQRAR